MLKLQCNCIDKKSNLPRFLKREAPWCESLRNNKRKKTWSKTYACVKSVKVTNKGGTALCALGTPFLFLITQPKEKKWKENLTINNLQEEKNLMI